MLQTGIGPTDLFLAFLQTRMRVVCTLGTLPVTSSRNILRNGGGGG